MNFLRRTGFGAIVALMALFGEAHAKEEGLLKYPDQWQPYMERVDSRDFLAIENSLGESDSDLGGLTLYEISSEKLASTIRIDEDIDGSYRLSLKYTDDPAGKSIRKTVRLPADVARRVLDSFTLTLTKKVYPATDHSLADYQKTNPYVAYWVNLRTKDMATAAGFTTSSRCMVGRDSISPFLDLVYKLRGYANGEATALEVDLAVNELRLSYPE